MALVVTSSRDDAMKTRTARHPARQGHGAHSGRGPEQAPEGCRSTPGLRASTAASASPKASRPVHWVAPCLTLLVKYGLIRFLRHYLSNTAN